jgi:hypothetical protein
MTERTVCIGNRYRMREAELELSQPCTPFWKINHRFGERDLSRFAYEFWSGLRLMSDFQRGRFAPAFQPEWRATVHEPAENLIPSGDPTMIELDTLAARLDTRLAELNAQAAEWEHETPNPACDLATKAERALETVRAVQEEVQKIRQLIRRAPRYAARRWVALNAAEMNCR